MSRELAVVVKASMSRLFAVLSVVLCVLPACAAEKKLPELPECLKQKTGGDSRKFSELTHEGKKFYIINSPCCDRFNPVFDEDGKQICALGGLTGRGDGKCPKFDIAD